MSQWLYFHGNNNSIWPGVTDKKNSTMAKPTMRRLVPLLEFGSARLCGTDYRFRFVNACHVHVYTFIKQQLKPHTRLHTLLTVPLWDIGKQYSPRCDAAERGVPSGAIPFACNRNFIEKWNKILKLHLCPLKIKVDSPK